MAGRLPWLIPKRNTNKETLTKVEAGTSSPSGEMYLLEGSKATAATLKSISGFIPVPMVSDILDLAIRVVEACESATFIEENVEKLRQRVCSLGILIVDKVPSDKTLNQDFQTNIKSLQTILTNIIKDLDEIKRQRRWRLVIFPELNKGRVDACLDRLDEALMYFNVSQQLRMEEVLEKILSKYTQVGDDVLKVQKQLDRIEAAIKPHSSPYSVGKQDIPPSPKLFYGRDSDVASIVNLLSDKHTSRVCITGPGGMGKTRLALAVIHNPTVQQVFGEYRFWVPCIKAASPDLLRRTLYTQLSITAQSYDSLDSLIDELKLTEDRRLVLLDNFETSWYSREAPDDQAQINDILSRLADLPHVALMATMTSSFPPDSPIQWKQHKLPALDVSAARQVFVGIYPEAASAKSTEVDELMNAVGHIPLAITLMAANGKQSQISAKGLVEEWKTAGTEMIDGMDRRIKISLDLVQAKDDKSEVLKLLATLSMLPNGTTMQNLYFWASDLTSHSRVVSLLLNAALIEQETQASGSSHVSLRPTIQAYMRQHKLISPEVQKRVRDACYKFVLDHNSIPDDLCFKSDLMQLASEENNIQYLLMQDDDSAENMRAEALVAFSFYLFKTKQSIVVAQLALTVATASRKNFCVAEAHVALGKMFKVISRYEEACQHFKEAHRIFKNLPSGADLARAGECGMQLVDVYQHMQKPFWGEMRTVVLQASEDLSCNKSNQYNVARALLGVGSFFWYSADWGQARETLTRAKEVFEKLCRWDSAAESFFMLARTEAESSNYPVALDMSLRALSLAEQSGDAYLICQTLNTTVRYMIALHVFDDVEPMLHRLLSQAQAMGQILGIAQALELLGFVHASRRDVHKACQFYAESQTQYGNVGSIEVREQDQTRCASNLQKLSTGHVDLAELKSPMLY
ncbi:hypothetical protein CVT25_004866 [Psilocybe cyanescens]|uniref:Novel STAND NTPase 1 domain-containing protein n=1 Tax=Psilocybe cyanescens TaxID=93625 RepID=A0A409XMJ2_PSICY|nr:hypothetical protein CVT25_004866 [Psilocybe cyanescens]